MRRVTGRSPTGDHAEPSWAAELPFDEACDLGLKFKQTAIYHVCDDQLSVSYCDQRRKFVPVSGNITLGFNTRGQSCLGKYLVFLGSAVLVRQIEYPERP